MGEQSPVPTSPEDSRSQRAEELSQMKPGRFATEMGRIWAGSVEGAAQRSAIAGVVELADFLARMDDATLAGMEANGRQDLALGLAELRSRIVASIQRDAESNNG